MPVKHELSRENQIYLQRVRIAPCNFEWPGSGPRSVNVPDSEFLPGTRGVGLDEKGKGMGSVLRECEGVEMRVEGGG